MGFEHDCIGIPAAFYDLVERLEHPTNESFAELDERILELGPHEVAHFLTLTENQESVARLEDYLKEYWPAYYVLIEKLIHAAKRTENEDVLGDLGQS